MKWSNKLVEELINIRKQRQILAMVAINDKNFEDSRSCKINFLDRGPYHIETSPLICKANQWTSFYMIVASVMKELNTQK